MYLKDLPQLCEDAQQPIAEAIVTEISFLQQSMTRLKAHVSEYGTVEYITRAGQPRYVESSAYKSYLTSISRYATLCKNLALKAAASSDGDALLKGRRVLSFLAYWDGYRSDPSAFRAECITSSSPSTRF